MRDAAEDTQQKRRVNAAFDARADSWGLGYRDAASFRNDNFLVRRRYVLELLDVEPGTRRVLDAGCGTGDYVPLLQERYAEVWCMDAAPAMAAKIQERFRDAASSVFAAQGDIERMTYPDGWFDAVVCAGVLEYLTEDGPALRDIYRVLRPGGCAVITVPNALSPWMWLDIGIYRLLRGAGSVLAALGLFERVAGRPRADRTYTHRYFIPWKINAAASRAGFEVVDFRYCSFGSFALGRGPGFVRLSRWCERYARRPVAGLWGLNYIVKCIKR